MAGGGEQTNPYEGIQTGLQSAAAAQTAAIQQASQISQNIANQNIAFATQQSQVAQQTLAPFLAAGQQGITGIDDLLGNNGAQAQQQYIQNLVNSGSQMAQPTIDLMNSWNTANNPLNQLGGLVSYAGQVVGNPVAPTAPGLPNAPTYSDIVGQVYNDPNIKNSLDQQIQYGMRGMNSSLAAQGLQGSGAQMAQLQQYGQQTAQGALATDVGQAAQYEAQNYATATGGLNSQYQTQAGMYSSQLANSTSQFNNLVTQGMGAANSAYGVNTASLSNMYNTAYSQSAGSVQQSLMGLIGMGQNTANSLASNANSLANSVNSQNTWSGEQQANAALQSGQVQAQLDTSMAQNAFQAYQAGYGGGGASVGTAAGVIGGTIGGSSAIGLAGLALGFL